MRSGGAVRLAFHFRSRVLACELFLVALAMVGGVRTTTAASNEADDPRRAALNVQSSTSLAEVSGLIDEFSRANPDISLRFSRSLSGPIFDRVAHPGGPDDVPDVAWSSAMDSQIKLANDGYALQYHSPESRNIYPWAQWNDYAFGVTAEPVVFVYNKRLFSKEVVPQDRVELLRALLEKRAFFRGRIATYDPGRAEAGLLFITQDVKITATTWDLVRAMGQADVKLYDSSQSILDDILEGDLVFAYNVLGSYAMERAKADSNLGIVFPRDYTLRMSRIALIPRAAPHPEEAKRFIDFLLSPRAQAFFAGHSLGSVREDQTAGSDTSNPAVRPIAMDVDLLTYLDQAKRRRFLKQWDDALKGR